MKLSELYEKTIEVDVIWFDETITMGIRPAKWTTERLLSLLMLPHVAGAGDGAEEAALQSAEAIAEMIGWWDILDDDGERVPVTADMVMKLPQSLFAGISAALEKRVRDEGKTSPAT